jgi:hypothetical protein
MPKPSKPRAGRRGLGISSDGMSADQMAKRMFSLTPQQCLAATLQISSADTADVREKPTPSRAGKAKRRK